MARADGLVMSESCLGYGWSHDVTSRRDAFWVAAYTDNVPYTRPAGNALARLIFPNVCR